MCTYVKCIIHFSGATSVSCPCWLSFTAGRTQASASRVVHEVPAASIRARKKCVRLETNKQLANSQCLNTEMADRRSCLHGLACTSSAEFLSRCCHNILQKVINTSDLESQPPMRLGPLVSSSRAFLVGFGSWCCITVFRIKSLLLCLGAKIDHGIITSTPSAITHELNNDRQEHPGRNKLYDLGGGCIFDLGLRGMLLKHSQLTFSRNVTSGGKAIFEFQLTYM